MDTHSPHQEDLSDPSFASEASTPTKSSFNDATPRPLHRSKATYRPKIDRIDFSKFLPESSTPLTPETRGYSISYLRRVPELALLAHRVAKQEIRAARKIEKEKELKTRKKETSSSKSSAAPKVRQPTAKDIKRLFVRVVNELYREGSIVIWDCPSHSCSNDFPLPDSSYLWKTSSSSVTTSSIANSTGESLKTDGDDTGDLSDPDPHEDVYLTLKPAFLADRLEEVIPVVQKNERRRAGSQPYRGASCEGLLQHLKADDRWSFIHIDSVKDALKYLEVEGRAWMVGKDQWQLTV